MDEQIEADTRDLAAVIVCHIMSCHENDDNHIVLKLKWYDGSVAVEMHGLHLTYN